MDETDEKPQTMNGAQRGPCFANILRMRQAQANQRAGEHVRYGKALQTLREAMPLTLTHEQETAFLVVMEGRPQ